MNWSHQLRRHRIRAVCLLTAALMALTTGAAFASLPRGLDTSHYQHHPGLDWTAVRSTGVRFAFLKATEGTTFTDPYFARDWAATAAAGIYHGAYHFARPSKSSGSAVKQADYFVSVITKAGSQKVRGTLPPVLDLETTGGLTTSQLIAWTRTWLERVQARTGRSPIIYVSPAFWREHMGNSSTFHAYPLWIANYGVSSPSVPGLWRTWSFWQSTSTGRIKGISGNVDSDVFNGSLTQLQKFALAYNPTPTSVTVTANNTKPTVGGTITVSATVRDSAGKAVSGQPVRLRQHIPGQAWTTLATVNTNSAGTVSRAVKITQPVQFAADFRGSADDKASSSAALNVTLTPLATTLTVTGSTAPVQVGAPLAFSGRLVSGGTALAGRTLTLVRRAGSTAVTVATAKTAANGSYRFATRAVATGAYQVVYRGEPAYRSTSAQTASLRVNRLASRLAVAASRTVVPRNHKVRIAGRLAGPTTAVAGRLVTIQRKVFGSTVWHTRSRVRTDSLGRFASTQKVTSGAWYRAVYAGDTTYLPASPANVRVTLQRKPAALRVAVHRRAGHPLLSGRLTSRGHGLPAKLRVWSRTPGTTGWRWVGVLRTHRGSGAWQLSVSPARTTEYRVTFNTSTAYVPVTRYVLVRR